MLQKCCRCLQVSWYNNDTFVCSKREKEVKNGQQVNKKWGKIIKCQECGDDWTQMRFGIRINALPYPEG